MKGGHRSPGTKPGINGDLVLLPVAQAAVVGNTDVPLQLRDLWGSEHTGWGWGGMPSPGQGRTSPKVNGPSPGTHTALSRDKRTASACYFGETEKPTEKTNTRGHPHGSVG